MQFLKSLEALAAVENLIPQASGGLRAGVIRELVRILELGVSKGAAISGRVAPGIRGISPPTVGRGAAFEVGRELE